MSTSPAFLKGLFGAPDDDPLLHPSRPTETSDAGPPRPAAGSPADAPQKPSATTEPTLMSPTSTATTGPETVRRQPSSLFDRIKDVMEKTATTAPSDDSAAPSSSTYGYRICSHYASPHPPSGASDRDATSHQASDHSASTKLDKQIEKPRIDSQIMQVRNGEHEPRDIATINDALNHGWCVETVRSASSGDTLVDVVLRRRQPPSLFDFGDTDR